MICGWFAFGLGGLWVFVGDLAGLWAVWMVCGWLESLWVVSSFTGNGASSSNNVAVYRHIFSEF